MHELLPQTIVVTGAAGFIGSHTCQALLDAGHEVIGIDNLNDYYLPLWKEQNLLSLTANNNFHFYQKDIRDETALETIFKIHKPSVVIHLAAMAGVRNSLRQPNLYTDVNVGGTAKLLTVSEKHEIKKFIFASSSSVYGNQITVPFKETDACNEPISPYAATKKSGEMLCYAASQNNKNISVTCLRFFTVYGPKGRPDMAPYLFTQAILHDVPIKFYGEGTTKRDYTFIDDIVSGIVNSLSLSHSFEIFNLGNDAPVFLKDFITILEEITGKKAQRIYEPIPTGDVHQTWADISKAKELLAYQPSTSLYDGLSVFVNWYKTNRL